MPAPLDPQQLNPTLSGIDALAAAGQPQPNAGIDALAAAAQRPLLPFSMFSGLGSLGNVLVRALATAPYVMARGAMDPGALPQAVTHAATVNLTHPLADTALGIGPGDFAKIARQYGYPY
jgi:hypothetical protein